MIGHGVRRRASPRGVYRWLLFAVLIGFVGLVGARMRRRISAPGAPFPVSPPTPTVANEAALVPPLDAPNVEPEQPAEAPMPSEPSAAATAAADGSEKLLSAVESRISVGRWLAPLAALVSVAVLIVMEIQAIGNHYQLRVTADTPTFLALIRDMGLHPLTKVSVFFGNSSSDSIHASPYLQVLGWIWKAVASPSQFWNPISLGEFAAIVTIPASLFVLAMLWLYVRRLAGTTAAWASIPIVLSLFGPAHVIYAGDMSLNGFLTTGYFPSTVATGFLLATMVAVDVRRPWPTALAVLLTALTLTSDPFAGLVLVLVLILYACATVAKDPRERWRTPLIFAGGAALSVAWPAMNTLAAYSKSGAPLPGLVLVAFAAPNLWLALRRRTGLAGLLARARRLDPGPIFERRVAELGLWATAALIVWALYVMGHWPSGVPALRSYRLGFYWNDQRDRWLLLLLPGACGLLGLWRATRSGRPVPFMWFALIFAVGLLGAIVHLATGHELPLYYRLILASQLPLAIGAAVFVVRHRRRAAVAIMVLTLTAAFGYKVVTLEAEPVNLNYFGAQLGTLWSFHRIIPPGPGLIATDPSTGYYMPVTTGHRVLAFSKGHADSGTEQTQAEAGYELLRGVYRGTGPQAAAALRRMWALGVRWVVVEKFTDFDPGSQQQLFAAPYNSLITAPDVNRMATYNSRLAAVGVQTYDDQEFTVYRLVKRRLLSATNTGPSLAPNSHATIAAALRLLARTRGPAAPQVRDVLYQDGVRMVTLSYGEFGSRPQLTAYGRSLSADGAIRVPVNSGRWQVNCVPLCNSAPAARTITSLGRTLHSDGRFNTVVSVR
jgi:hypothetical protein